MMPTKQNATTMPARLVAETTKYNLSFNVYIIIEVIRFTTGVSSSSSSSFSTCSS